MKQSIVICPMKEEMAELLGKIEKYDEKAYGEIKGYQFRIGNETFFAFIGRIGKANIGFDLGYISSQLDIKRIYVVGVAGSLKEEIVPLNVVVADKVSYYDVDVTSGSTSKYLLGQMPGEELYYKADEKMLKTVSELNTTLTISVGTVISGDSFATKKNMTPEVLKSFDNPLAVDMESGAVAQCAKRLGVPFMVIRGISDNVFTSGDSGDVFDEFLSISARRAASVFLHLVKKEYVSDDIEDQEDTK